MSPEKSGSLIGAVFGLVFVVVNTGSVLPAVAVVLRVLAVAAFLVVLIAVRHPASAGGRRSTRGGFGRPYWLVVTAEGVGIWGGLAVLNGPLDAPQAAVAWISSVVGAHFVALAVVWREPLFHVLGAALLGCGAVGLVLAVRELAAAAVDLVGGVLPGAILLGFGLWGSTRGADSPDVNAAL